MTQIQAGKAGKEQLDAAPLSYSVCSAASVVNGRVLHSLNTAQMTLRDANPRHPNPSPRMVTMKRT